MSQGTDPPEVTLTSNPAYRAGNAKDLLAYLEAVRPGSLAHLQSVVPHAVATLERSARTDWVDIEIDGLRVAELVRALGADGARDLWRRFTREQLIRSPSVRALSDGVVRVFGRSVATCIKAVPLVFKQSWRECGTVEVDWGERQAVVRIVGMPPQFARFPAYALMFEGVFLALYDLADTTPQLDYRADLSTGRIEASFRW
jgi:hypothetical protein